MPKNTKIQLLLAGAVQANKTLAPSIKNNFLNRTLFVFWVKKTHLNGKYGCSDKGTCHFIGHQQLTPSPLLTGVLLLVNCLLCRIHSMLLAASLMHRNMLQRVLQAPQAFFESTPTGRLLNRFSKDVDAIDSHIPDNIDIWMRTFWYTLNVLLICSALTPMFLIVIAPLMVFYWWVQVNRKSDRLINMICMFECVCCMQLKHWLLL